MEASPLRGLFAAVLTPQREDLSCDDGLFAAHCRALLAAGCDGLALFATTGEGPAFTVEERMAAFEMLAAAGVPVDRVLLGAGCAALPDVVRLTRHALASGCARVMVIPPFFFKDVGDEGVFRAYAEVIERVGDDRLRLYLYNYPAVSGVTIRHAVIARLIDRYPKAIDGVKDSSGDWQYMAGLLRRFPELAVFSGSEVLVPPLLAAGGAGSVSGLANIVPGLIRRLSDARPERTDDPVLLRVNDLFEAVVRLPIVPALKALAARVKREPGWRRVRPPLVPLDSEAERPLVAALDRACEVSGVDA